MKVMELLQFLMKIESKLDKPVTDFKFWFNVNWIFMNFSKKIEGTEVNPELGNDYYMPYV